MPKNHARSRAARELRDLLQPVRVKHTELLKLLADQRCLELVGLMEFFGGEVTTHAEAVHILDTDPRFRTLCETCGWSLSMICPECSQGCGCSTDCTGWRHREHGSEDDDFGDGDPFEDEHGEWDEDEDEEYEYEFAEPVEEAEPLQVAPPVEEDLFPPRAAPPVEEDLFPPRFAEAVEEEEATLIETITADLTFEQKMQLAKELHLGSLVFREGDRICAARRLQGSFIDEDLEDEGEDATVRFDVPAGAKGRILKVRQYVAPFPYVVIFDNNVELSVRQDDVSRIS
ncbi:hypothetical protein E6R60_26460 [Streptomyces sp. A0642]|uniref:hypothetical protein n=1 Tax=Streptomyces sp. A0642 TaxID=2563100 RepID=UPI0010A21EA9|nr:hypothetical protein [Streptomyces sp. A0642]THA72476.1 hypothetical protein E6R60_26460 [Streptomyces sp. A0642]